MFIFETIFYFTLENYSKFHSFCSMANWMRSRLYFNKIWHFPGSHLRWNQFNLVESKLRWMRGSRIDLQPIALVAVFYCLSNSGKCIAILFSISRIGGSANSQDLYNLSIWHFNLSIRSTEFWICERLIFLRTKLQILL